MRCAHSYVVVFAAAAAIGCSGFLDGCAEVCVGNKDSATPRICESGPSGIVNPIFVPVPQVIDVEFGGGPPSSKSIDGDAMPCECSFAQTVRLVVSQVRGANSDKYRMLAGAFGSKQGQLKIDRADWKPLPNVDAEFASVELCSGWTTLIRRTGRPPQRTIRISTGRPSKRVPHQGGQQQLAADQKAAAEFGALAIIDPGATTLAGREYMFLSTKSGETCTIRFEVLDQDGNVAMTVDLQSGHYLTFDRSTPKNVEVLALPTAATLTTLPKYVEEAIKQSNTYSADYQFSK